MATSLQDMVRTGSQNLGLVSNEELGNLSKASQQPVAPTTPASAAVLGASPDQAKMAGTGANKLLAIRASVQQSKDYATQQREQKKATASPDQQTSLQGLQQLAGTLGDLRNRVPQMVIANAKQDAASVDPAKIQFTPDELSTMGVPADKTTDFSQAFEDYLAGGDKNTALAKMQTISGQPLSDTDIKNLEDANAQKVQDNTVNKITGANLTMGAVDPALYASLGVPGVASVGDLSKMVGKDVSGMSYDEFSSALQSSVNNKVNQASLIRTKLSDPTIGQAQRDELQQRLKGLGETGIRTAADKVNNLAAQFKDGDTITVNGQQTKLSDLYSDSAAQGAMAKLVDASKSGDTKAIADAESAFSAAYGPAALQHFKDNQAAVTQQINSLSTDTKNFAAVQDYNKNFLTMLDGMQTGVPSQLAAKLIPGYGDVQAQQYDTSKLSPVVQYLKDSTQDPTARQNLVGNLSALSSSPRFAEIQGMSADQLKAAGLLDANGAQKIVDFDTKVASLSPNTSDRDMLSIVFGNADTAEQALEAMSSVGIPAFAKDLLDVNGDGKPDSVGTIRDKLIEASDSGRYNVIKPAQMQTTLDQLKSSMTDFAGLNQETQANQKIIDTTSKNITSMQSFLAGLQRDAAAPQNQNDKQQATVQGQIKLLQSQLSDAQASQKEAQVNIKFTKQLARTYQPGGAPISISLPKEVAEWNPSMLATKG